MNFEVVYERGALKDLKRLDRPVALRVIAKIRDVAEHGYGFEPLTEFQYGWKIRVGDYRALCEVDFGLRLIKVYVIAHRREVYKRR
jgi:mRNA interferase RelE/StbE